ncbi:hypothetical protein JNE12002_32370 [Escherichia coli]
MLIKKNEVSAPNILMINAELNNSPTIFLCLLKAGTITSLPATKAIEDIMIMVLIA